MRIPRGLLVGLKRKTAVFTLLFMLMARCLDKLEAAAAWPQPVRAAVSALSTAAYLAARRRALRGADAPRLVAIPAPPPGFSRWL